MTDICSLLWGVVLILIVCVIIRVWTLFVVMDGILDGIVAPSAVGNLYKLQPGLILVTASCLLKEIKK
jgi:hypothetical protein